MTTNPALLEAIQKFRKSAKAAGTLPTTEDKDAGSAAPGAQDAANVAASKKFNPLGPEGASKESVSADKAKGNDPTKTKLTLVDEPAISPKEKDPTEGSGSLKSASQRKLAEEGNDLMAQLTMLATKEAAEVCEKCKSDPCKCEAAPAVPPVGKKKEEPKKDATPAVKNDEGATPAPKAAAEVAPKAAAEVAPTSTDPLAGLDLNAVAAGFQKEAAEFQAGYQLGQALLSQTQPKQAAAPQVPEEIAALLKQAYTSGQTDAVAQIKQTLQPKQAAQYTPEQSGYLAAIGDLTGIVQATLAKTAAQKKAENVAPAAASSPADGGGTPAGPEAGGGDQIPPEIMQLVQMLEQLPPEELQKLLAQLGGAGAGQDPAADPAAAAAAPVEGAPAAIPQGAPVQ